MPKYFKKLLLFSVILVLLPVLLWGIYSYVHSSSAVIEKFSVQNKQTLYRTQLKVEQVLETIDYSMTQFMLSPTFQLVNFPLGIPEFVEIRELSNGMQKLKVERLGVEGFALLNREKDWMITNDGFQVISQSKLGDLFEQYNSLSKTSQWILEARGNQTNPSLVKKIPLLSNAKNPKGLIIMRMNKSKLNELLLHDVTFGDLYIFDQKHQIIVSSSDAEETNEIIAFFNHQEIQDSGNIVADVGNSKKIIEYSKSNYNNWIYMSVFSVDATTSDLRKMANFTILFCFFIFMLMSIIIIMGTRKMYHPIRKIYDLSKQETFSKAEKGKDEFLYIERRIGTLMKALSMLNDQLEYQSHYLTDLFILKLLLGLVQSNDQKKQEFISLLSWKWLTVLSLQIDTLEVKGYSEKDKNLILFAMDNIASELVPPSQRIGTMVMDQTQVIILIGQQETEEAFKIHINRLASMIKNSIYNYLKIEISIGIGGIYEEMQWISKSYKESLTALNYRISLGTNVILHLDEIIDRKSQEFKYPHKLEEQLRHSIEKMDYSESKMILNQFFKEIMNKEVAYKEYQFIVLQLLSSITRIIHDQDKSIQDVAGRDVTVEQLFLLHSEEEICEWLYDSVIKPTIKYLENSRCTQTFNLTDAIIQIIHHDFESDLSLEYCAAQVNFHPSYVSRVFKKEMGVTFSDYLSNYRLKMAETWLIETNMNISKIAERFKYNSSAAFIRYFRKMEGVTPGEFRKKHKKK